MGWAVRAGKHVYCRKPLCHTPFEARVMREPVARQKVCTQMGNQGSALNGLRRAVEFVRAGGESRYPASRGGPGGESRRRESPGPGRSIS